LRENEDAIVQIHLSKPAVLFSKDKFIIRNSSEDKTLGGGYIIEPSPLHHRRRTAKLTDELTKLSTGILKEDNLSAMINAALKKEFRPFTAEELADKVNLGLSEIIAETEKPDAGIAVYKSGQQTLLDQRSV
jgi:selenocysteine-specific elongation factor